MEEIKVGDKLLPHTGLVTVLEILEGGDMLRVSYEAGYAPETKRIVVVCCSPEEMLTADQAAPLLREMRPDADIRVRAAASLLREALDTHYYGYEMQREIDTIRCRAEELLDAIEEVRNA